MREFKSNNNNFIRRTRWRFISEIFLFVLLTVYFWFGRSKGLLDGLELLVLVVFASYIIFGLLYYSKAKAIAQKFSVYLMDNTLGFPDTADIKQIPYTDLEISKVKKKNDEIVEVHLKTTFGQSIKLQGLHNMKELYEGLRKKINE